MSSKLHANRVNLIASPDYQELARTLVRDLSSVGLRNVVHPEQLDTSIPVVAIGDVKLGDRHYALSGAVPYIQLQQLITSIATGIPIASNSDTAKFSDSPVESTALEMALTLAELEVCVEHDLAELVGADWTNCYFYDAETFELWSAREGDDGGTRLAIAGLIGWSARTGLVIRADYAPSDPRFNALTDSPSGADLGSIIVHPILGSGGLVEAILIGHRLLPREVFCENDAVLIANYAARLNPHLLRVSAEQDSAAEAEQLFRPAAIEARDLPRAGELLRLRSQWSGWRLVFLATLGLVILSLGATTPAWIECPALIGTSSRSAVIVPLSAVIRSDRGARVGPGMRVEIANAGQPTQTLYGFVGSPPHSMTSNELCLLLNMNPCIEGTAHAPVLVAPIMLDADSALFVHSVSNEIKPSWIRIRYGNESLWSVISRRF